MSARLDNNFKGGMRWICCKMRERVKEREKEEEAKEK